MNTTSSERQHKKMLETPVTKLLISLSIPTAASQLITVIYNTADTWFVSKLSNEASAAVGITFALISIIQACGFGFGMGCGSLISRRLGQKKDEEANIFASSAFFAAAFIGAVIGVFGLLFLSPLMTLLGSTADILPYSMSYAKYILIGAPLSCASFVLNNILRAEGEPKKAMYGMCIGGLINMVLDPIMIFSLDLGVAGASIATVLSQIISFCILFSFFLRKKSIVLLDLRYCSKKISVYGQILSTGFPTICRQGLGSLSTALLNNKAKLYGSAAVAAISVVGKLYNLVRNMIIGVGQGFQTIAGYNYGAGNKTRAKQAFYTACVIGTVVCLVFTGTLALFSHQIISWFRDDPDVIEIGSHALLFYCATIPFMAYSTFVNQLYQCLGFRVRATLLASCRQGIFFIPLVFLLPKFLELTGVSMIQPGADFLTFLISIPFQLYFCRVYLTDGTENKAV